MSAHADLINVEDYEAAARALLPKAVYDYYAGGAEDEQTLRANRAAFSRYSFLPRVLQDVSNVDTTVELFGARTSSVLIAPTAFMRLAHADGESAAIRAAGNLDTVFITSTLATTTIEDVARAAPEANLWLQLYVFRDRELTRGFVQRAVDAGCRALCLTVTVPVQGKRERDVRNRFALPSGIEMANFTGLRQARFPDAPGSSLEAYIGREFDPTLNWQAVEWLASISPLPILLKGICHPDDARLALEHGVSGVIVSNHGGRQLDAAIATLDALPAVADAIAGRIPVILDGGVRRGADVVKAIALGATAAMIGRPVLWGLAVAGQAGVEAVLTILRQEVARVLALTGRSGVSAVTRDLLQVSTAI